MLLAGILVIGGTVMFMTTRTATAVNTFSIGKNRINIIEEGIDPDAVEWGATTKPVKLRNPTGADMTEGVVRAMLVPYLSDAIGGGRIGGNLGAIGAPSGNQLVMGDLTFHFVAGWGTNWFYKDGFFYYRKVLQPGETTEQLLAGVTLASGKESEYKDIIARVDVLADIIQTAGNAPTVEWGVTVSNGVVSP